MLNNSKMPSTGEDRTDIAGNDVSILGVVTHVRNIRYNGVSSGVLPRDPHQRPSVSHRLRCRYDPHQWPSDVGIYSWICSINKTRVLAARGTSADLSIHRLEPTVTQRPYTAVRTSPCSCNPFLTLRRPAKLPVPV